ncbi:MAG: RdgB/HAM1 family non-canonical purine NTP pyrophosphatase [Desulfonatronovibrionaceae bacterium]
MPEIVLATRNKGKIKELKSALIALHPDISVLGLDSFPELGVIPETGSSFAENALQKARIVCAHTNRVSLADDSGLVVPALNGDPGIFSARYSGKNATDRDNNRKLLKEMQLLEGKKRQASFVCVLAVCAPNGESVLAEGRWEGKIARSPSGENGFGYDPVFEDPEQGCTAAELPAGEKMKKSHRARALNRLLDLWPEFWHRAGQTPG